MENDFDIDKFFEDQNAFKPINKGLGFHHSIKSKSEMNTHLKSNTLSLKNSLEKRAKMLGINAEIPQDIDRGDLSPFYSAPKEVKVKVKEESLPSLEATYLERSTAYILDLLCVSFLFSLTVTLFLSVSGFDFSIFFNKGSIVNIFTETLPLFIFYYLFYFSFLDKTSFSTLGKKILKIKLIHLKQDESISMYQTFLRAFVSLVSLLSLGLLAFSHFAGRLSDTKVIKAP